MIEATAVLAVALLVARDLAAVGDGAAARRRARVFGVAALPVLVVFAALVAGRIAGYLAAPPP